MSAVHEIKEPQIILKTLAPTQENAQLLFDIVQKK